MIYTGKNKAVTGRRKNPLKKMGKGIREKNQSGPGWGKVWECGGKEEKESWGSYETCELYLERVGALCIIIKLPFNIFRDSSVK